MDGVFLIEKELLSSGMFKILLFFILFFSPSFCIASGTTPDVLALSKEIRANDSFVEEGGDELSSQGDRKEYSEVDSLSKKERKEKVFEVQNTVLVVHNVSLSESKGRHEEEKKEEAPKVERVVSEPLGLHSIYSFRKKSISYDVELKRSPEEEQQEINNIINGIEGDDYDSGCTKTGVGVCVCVSCIFLGGISTIIALNLS